MEKLIRERDIEICKNCKVEMEIEKGDNDLLRCPSCDSASWDCGTMNAVEQTISRILLK